MPPRGVGSALYQALQLIKQGYRSVSQLVERGVEKKTAQIALEWAQRETEA